MVSKWYAKHVNDPYVKKANKEGYRSRAVFKLQEIQDKTKVIKSGDAVADLGSAPGAWSEYLVKLVGAKGRVVSCDLLLMQDIKGVAFIQGDFCAKDTQDQMLGECAKFDVIVSDMAPNMCGHQQTDQLRAMSLCELVIDIAKQCLKQDGCILMKTFQGVGFKEMLTELRGQYKSVSLAKPKASMRSASEVYIVAKGYKRKHVLAKTGDQE